MKNLVSYFVLSLFLFSCKKEAQKPVWINEKTELDFHFQNLKFKCEDENWEVFLITSIQPIELKSSYKSGILTIQSPLKGGVLEGMAQLYLRNKDADFYYPIKLTNTEASSSVIDFRSPKTLNPDSILNQQRIIYQIDEFRNIVPNQRKELFKEDELRISPKAGIYKTSKNNPLTSYYVQPGSCVEIPLTFIYNTFENSYEIKAGPLMDKYKNTIADGTLVTFVYESQQIGKMEINALKGFAIAKIPANVNYQIYAQIDQLTSKKIVLKP